jgi:hypothetical protein
VAAAVAILSTDPHQGKSVQRDRAGWRGPASAPRRVRTWKISYASSPAAPEEREPASALAAASVLVDVSQTGTGDDGLTADALGEGGEDASEGIVADDPITL